MILNVLNENPDTYLLKREIQRILADKLEDQELKRIGEDMRRLMHINLVQIRGNRYHLTEIGTIIITSIERIREELAQPLLQKFTRAMLLSSIYEGEGFRIHSDKHIRQIGFLIIETINDLIEQDRILEWAEYLQRFTDIIESLSNFIENYVEEPELYQQLFHMKSEIELEFSKYHEMAQKSFSKQLSMIQAGFDPIKMRRVLRILNEDQLNRLNMSLEPLFDEWGLIENDILWEIILEDELALSKKLDKTIIEDSVVKTNVADEVEVENIFEEYLSVYQAHGKKLKNKLKEHSFFFISDLIPELGDSWFEMMNLIGSIPSIEREFIIPILPLDKKITINQGVLWDGLFFREKEVSRSNENQN